MIRQVRTAVAATSSWVPNLIVLTFLTAIGWWGHRYHWSLLHHAEPHSSSQLLETSASLPLQGNGSPDATLTHTLDGKLPVIEFATAEAAKNCGILTDVATQQAMNELVTASGTVGYDQTRIAELSVRVPGVVWRVMKRVGEVVERGDVLMIVDSAEVGAAKASLLEAAVVYNLKKQTRQRLEGIQNSVSARNLREAEFAEDVARAQRFNALQRLLNLGFSLQLDDISELSAEGIADRLHLLGLPPSLDAATESANLIALVAPFAGLVTHCEVVRGEIVGPSKPQYVVADISRMWINLDIRHEDCARVRVGSAVAFQSDGGLASVSGTLTWIGTEIDPRTRMVQARAEVVNPPLDDAVSDLAARRLLQVNAFGAAKITVANNPETVVVPNEALHWQWEIGRDVVFVPSHDGRRFEPRTVRKGMVRDDYAQILDGLQQGDRIVTAGSRILLSELSETLQKRWGDNATAVRGFGLEQQSGGRPN